LLLDALSVCLGVVPVVLVNVGNVGQITDDLGSDVYEIINWMGTFVSDVLVVSLHLDLDVLCLEVSEEVVDRLDGFVVPGSGLHQ
jgi:hypothetical protein